MAGLRAVSLKPIAYSRCEGFGSLAMRCAGSALAISFTPAEDPAEAGYETGFTAVSYRFPDQLYTDFARHYGATGEFALLRHVWDADHPFIEAFQANAGVTVALPDLGIRGVVTLTGSRAAIGQAVVACQE